MHTNSTITTVCKRRWPHISCIYQPKSLATTHTAIGHPQSSLHPTRDAVRAARILPERAPSMHTQCTKVARVLPNARMTHRLSTLNASSVTSAHTPARHLSRSHHRTARIALDCSCIPCGHKLYAGCQPASIASAAPSVVLSVISTAFAAPPAVSPPLTACVSPFLNVCSMSVKAISNAPSEDAADCSHTSLPGSDSARSSKRSFSRLMCVDSCGALALEGDCCAAPTFLSPIADNSVFRCSTCRSSSASASSASFISSLA
mmetsp:Transcript_7736/g.17318  ORF Transcript_7736/g.17318 Transcript_7736/m.17318 type:complete len:261 (+) Transcript_7736:174-956(+)